MNLTPQPYPLWLAQVIDDEVQVGRIIAWVVGDPATSNPDAIAHPIIAFADDDGFVWATMQSSRTGSRFICDSRDAALDAAEGWILDGRGARRTGSAS